MSVVDAPAPIEGQDGDRPIQVGGGHVDMAVLVEVAGRQREERVARADPRPAREPAAAESGVQQKLRGGARSRQEIRDAVAGDVGCDERGGLRLGRNGQAWREVRDGRGVRCRGPRDGEPEGADAYTRTPESCQ
jgi:hypothetical protein